MKRIWNEEPILCLFGLAAAIVVAVLILVVVEKTCGEWHGTDGEVVAKAFAPEQNGIGNGVAVDGNGNVGVVMVNTHTPEVWSLVVKQNGNTFSTKTTPFTWGNVKPGDTVIVARRYGPLFGSHNATRACLKESSK